MLIFYMQICLYTNILYKYDFKAFTFKKCIIILYYIQMKFPTSFLSIVIVHLTWGTRSNMPSSHQGLEPSTQDPALGNTPLLMASTDLSVEHTSV